MDLKVGFHSSISLGYLNSIKAVEKLGGNAVQIFLKSPRGWNFKVLDLEEAKIVKKYVEDNNIFLVGHSSYLINLCKDFKQSNKGMTSLIDDMNKIEQLGGVGVVMHVGKQLKLEKYEALDNLRKNVSLVLEKSPKDVMLLLENAAGQGTEIGLNIDEIKEIIDMFDAEEQNRIGVCIDTAHGFAAGIQFGNKVVVQKFYEEFDQKIGLDKLICVHLNDSKRDFGMRVDWHQDIGYGFIDSQGLREVAKIAKDLGKPLILETPCEKEDYNEQIEKVKFWTR